MLALKTYFCNSFLGPSDECFSQICHLSQPDMEKESLQVASTVTTMAAKNKHLNKNNSFS